MRSNKLLRYLGLAAGVLSAAVVANAVTASASTGGGPVAQRVQGSGSDTTQIVMMHLDGLYMVSEGCAKSTASVTPLDFSCIAPDPTGTIFSENYEHDQLQEADFLGSSTGIKQLCFQGQANVAQIDFARSSRGPKTPTDTCTGLHFVAYARDGISVESHDDGTTASGIHALNNPDPLCPPSTWCVTQTQLQHIYGNGCTIKTWDQIGGQPLQIQIYTPQSGSGTRAQFETFLFGSSGGDSSQCLATDGEPASNATVPENQNTGIATADKNTFIFPFSFAIFHTEINDAGGFHLASIDGVTANATTIGCETTSCTAFPYSRYVYNVFCGISTGTCNGGGTHLVSQAADNYVNEEGWICKPGLNEPAGATWSGVGTPAVSSGTASLPHEVSPHYNVNWQKLIAQKITSRGFAPLPVGTIGGGDTSADHCRLFTT